MNKVINLNKYLSKYLNPQIIVEFQFENIKSLMQTQKNCQKSPTLPLPGNSGVALKSCDFFSSFFFAVLNDFPNFPSSRAYAPKLASPRHSRPRRPSPVLRSKAQEDPVLGLQGLKELNLSRYFLLVWGSCLLCCRVSVTLEERMSHSQAVTGTVSKSLCQGLPSRQRGGNCAAVWKELERWGFIGALSPR